MMDVELLWHWRLLLRILPISLTMWKPIGDKLRLHLLPSQPCVFSVSLKRIQKVMGNNSGQAFIRKNTSPSIVKFAPKISRHLENWRSISEFTLVNAHTTAKFAPTSFHSLEHWSSITEFTRVRNRFPAKFAPGSLQDLDICHVICQLTQVKNHFHAKIVTRSLRILKIWNFIWELIKRTKMENGNRGCWARRSSPFFCKIYFMKKFTFKNLKRKLVDLL